ncbi:MAG: XRE family transcriptional regulator [Bacteroidetes bacterium]|nr:MAG: XRE family transcriptional regulator [Bacteroidota bacterium]
MELSFIIGRNIKNYREKLGYNQEHIASFLGVDRSLISFYENAEREISIVHLHKIADLFCIEIEDLMEENLLYSKVDLAFAFRADGISQEDLTSIASFQKIVKNYLKMSQLAAYEQ